MLVHNNDIPNGATVERHIKMDALEIYKREISRFSLLDPEEELALAKRVKKGDKEARELMIIANLRLVITIARDHEDLGLPLLDLINEGNIGLMTAVERFDYRKGSKFSTYARIWIRKTIKLALQQQINTIRLPRDRIEDLQSLRRLETMLWNIYGRRPLDCELATELNFTLKHVIFLRSISSKPLSLEAKIGYEGRELHEILPDVMAIIPSRYAETRIDSESMKKWLNRLNCREKRMISLYYGLSGKTTMSYAKIGRIYRRTHQRVQKIIEGALIKLQLFAEGKPLPHKKRKPYGKRKRSIKK